MLYQLSDPERPLAHLDTVARAWEPAVVPLYVADQRRVENPGQEDAYDFLGVGTGVVVQHAGRPFLVTAHHVMTEAGIAPTVFAVFAGRAVALADLVFVSDVDADLTAAYLDYAWYEREQRPRLLPVPLRDDRPGFRPTTRHVLLGYPGLLNRVAIDRGEVGRYLQVLTADRVAHGLPDTRVANPVAFHYDPAQATNASLEAVQGTSYLRGMSGGPALEVLERDEQPEVTNHAVRLGGVLCEWHPEFNRVVASGTLAVERLLAQITAQITEFERRYEAEARDAGAPGSDA